MRSSLICSSVVLLATTIGCGQSKIDDGTQAGDAHAGSAIAQSGGPAAAVHTFLEAVRLGNDDKASQMLTPVARQKTAEYNMVVAPPGSDTASFKVGEVEMVGQEGAHVASFWTDIDENGDKHTDTIIWMVRKEQQGWRIAGMATRVLEDQPAMILNFEEPEEMLAKQQAMEEEMSRRAGGESAENVDETTADTRSAEENLRPRQR